MSGLYLFASPLAGASGVGFFSPVIAQQLRIIRHFVCERSRTTRRILRASKLFPSLTELQFAEMGKHSTFEALTQATQWLRQGHSVAFFSEAGLPVLADPGALLVATCQKQHIPVIPCLSDSAILSALVASGFQAQSFTFHGYLPIQAQHTKKRIQAMDRKIHQSNHTHLFIETPFRTQRLLNQLLNALKPNTHLCIAAELHSAQARVQTQTVSEWKNHPPHVHKKPVVFLIGRLAIR